MKWTWEELEAAHLEFNTSRDRYTFRIDPKDGQPGHVLHVPGYFVGDPEMIVTLQRAAKVVSRRLPAELAKRHKSFCQ